MASATRSAITTQSTYRRNNVTSATKARITPIRLIVRTNVPRSTDSATINASTRTIAPAHAFDGDQITRTARPRSSRLIEIAAHTSVAWANRIVDSGTGAAACRM